MSSKVNEIAKKILITGANGFLARSIVDFLSSKAYEIIGLVRRDGVVSGNNFVKVYSDLETLLSNENGFSAIFHLAAFIPYGAMDKPSQQLIESNIVLTSKLVSSYPDARFVYASSTAVYGRPSVLPIEVESAFVNPDLYGLSKLAGEAIVRNHLNYAIIRFSSIIGPGLKSNSFIPIIIEKAMKNGIITILGDGKRQQNYIDVRDAAKLCIACSNITKNIAVLGVSNRSYSNKEVAEIIASRIATQIIFTGLDNSPSFLYTTDSTYSQLDFQQTYSLEQTISEMIQK